MSYNTHFNHIHFINNTAIFVGNQNIDENGPHLLDYNEIHTGGIKKIHVFYPEWSYSILKNYLEIAEFCYRHSLNKKIILHIGDRDYFHEYDTSYGKHVVIDRLNTVTFKLTPDTQIVYTYHKNDDPMIIVTIQKWGPNEEKRQMVVFKDAKYILHTKEQRKSCRYYDDAEEEVNDKLYNPWDFNLVDMYGCCSNAECFMGQCIYAYLCTDEDDHEFYCMKTNKLSVPVFKDERFLN